MDIQLNRNVWKRSEIELGGIISYKNRRDYARLLCDSYSEVAILTNCCCLRPNCLTYDRQFEKGFPYFNRDGISGMDFDSQGIFLAAGTRTGCFTILKFEQLYCSINGPFSDLYDENNCWWHICTDRRIDVVKWNPTNEDEVCCASKEEDKILFYDIHHAVHEPIRILRRGHWKTEHKGFFDIAFSSVGNSRLIASGFGGVYAWDFRIGDLPSLKFNSKYKSEQDDIFSIETDVEERIIFGGTANGRIVTWDIRGARSSGNVPFLESYDIGWSTPTPLYYPRGIHSLRRDPSCPSHLAFHAYGYESGVYNIYSKTVTHFHRPEMGDWQQHIYGIGNYFRRQAWMPRNSVYVVANPNTGVHLLDFSSRNDSEDAIILRNERVIQSTEKPISCVVHPRNDNIIAGTPRSKLVFISETKY